MVDDMLADFSDAIRSGEQRFHLGLFDQRIAFFIGDLVGQFGEFLFQRNLVDFQLDRNWLEFEL